MDADGRKILGNIFKNRIYEIFHGENYKKLRDDMLHSGMDAYCPSLNCNCPFKNVSSETVQSYPSPFVIEKIVLENTSLCNLRCPSCPVTSWYQASVDNAPHPRLAALPPDKIREILEDTKSTLKELWLYNYGESFYDRNFIEILRMARNLAPQTFLYTHTNGTIMPDGWAKTIVKEELLDSISFSIDGASQETFGKYRVNGKFSAAFKNLKDLAHFKKAMKKSKPDITWQYILFEWNDSTEEIERAQKTAEKIGVPIYWLRTSTPGNSLRYTEMDKILETSFIINRQKRDRKSLVCREIFNEPCILATGDVVCSCMDVEGFGKLGNVNQNGIYEIFHGSPFTRLRKQVMESSRGSYCAWLNCNCPFKSIPIELLPYDARTLGIRKLRIETISYCNLRCPECSLTEWYSDQWKDAKHPRLAHLSIDKIREILEDTKSTLREIWFYNYGEPFLDVNFPDILRTARSVIPQAFLYTHTNGTIFPKGWPDIIVGEGLLDAISFSIDGASQETYAMYRRGGNFQTAFENMVHVLELKRTLGKAKPDIIWQYILFEWNDSRGELEKAQTMAAEHGLTIQWILTHTKGRSKRFTEVSEEYQRLQGIKHYSSELLAAQTDTKFRSPWK
jgi:MoaA/NifB/PqqE/SkfB family radical SAM enzyme